VPLARTIEKGRTRTGDAPRSPRPTSRSARFVSLCLLALACSDPAPSGPPTIATHADDWRDEVIYQIVVDRFDDGDPSNDVLDGRGPTPDDLKRHQGGDWRGVTRRLDYVRELGATAIWISPVVENVDHTPREDGYHGYWASDFTRPNPRFGDLEDLRTLVREAHARDVLVLIDVVTNHTGRVFSYDLDDDGEVDEGELEPPYLATGYDVPLLFTHAPRLFAGEGTLALGPEHFHRRGFGNVGIREEKLYGDFPTGLRDLATGRDDVLEALVDTYVRWVQDTDVDGFRIDAVPHVEDAFWPRFGRRLRERLAALGKRRFFLLGEVFTTDNAYVASYSAPDWGIDAAFDLPLKFAFFDRFLLEGRAASEAAPFVEAQRALFSDAPQPLGIDLDPWESRVVLFDNHDTWRLRAELDDPRVVQLSLLVLLTLDGIPAIYYGTEQDYRGRADGDQRERLWDSGFETSGETFERIRTLTRLRAEEPALRRGRLAVRYASENDGFSEEPDAGMFAYERSDAGSRLLIVVNGHALQTSRATVPSGFPSGTQLVERLGGEGSWSAGPRGEVDVELAPRTGVILVAE